MQRDEDVTFLKNRECIKTRTTYDLNTYTTIFKPIIYDRVNCRQFTSFPN